MTGELHARRAARGLNEGRESMPSLRPHLTLIVLAATFAIVLFAATIGPPAAAAAKPSIRGASIHSRAFVPITAIVFGASQVVICVSRQCEVAFRQPQPGIWTTIGRRLTSLRKGQSREVIVFAASSTGEVSFLVRRVIVQ